MTQLDLQQEAAVRSEYRDTLVVAAAGSGKTRVLVERVAYLIEKCKVSPTEILAITFTRKAAGEMVKRLEERIGAGNAHRLRIGTMHGIALRYLRIFGDRLGFRPAHLTVYGEWEEKFLAKDTARLVKAKSGYMEALEKFYMTGEPPDEYSPHARFFQVFMQRLRSNNSMTYGMLLSGMKSVIRDIATRPLTNILVDEAQDMDGLQWQIIDQLQTASGCAVFAVGDDWQSVYAFRGAVPEHMVELSETWDVFKLETNYRSAGAIVDRSSRLIAHNRRRTEKNVRPHRRENGLVEVRRDMDSAAVAAFVRDLKDRHGSVTVLARIHVLLVKLSQELDALGVEHHYCGRQGKIIHSERFRRAHAIFKLIVNPFDNFGFALARQHLGVTDEQYLDIMRDAIDNYTSHVASWLGQCADSRWQAAFGEGEKWPLKMLADYLLGIIGDLDFGMAVRTSMGFAENNNNLRAYLDWVATFDLQEEVADPGKTGIQLMTIHAAKGLEFDSVVLVGLNEGIMPSKQAAEAGDIEEERRLAYVAATRARDRLYVTVRPETSESNGGKTYQNPESRFVKEMSL